VAHLLGQWLAAPLAVASLLTGVLLFVLVPGLGRAAQAATATPPHVTHTQRLLYTIAPAAAAILLAVNLTLARYGQARAGTPRPYRVGRPRARVSPGPANL